MSRLKVTIALSLAAILIPAADAGAHHFDHLLAPERACSGQTNTARPIAGQIRTAFCMHRFARRRAGRGSISMIRSPRRSARRKARDILRCQQFSHTACGRNAFFWHRRVGLMRRCYRVAENIRLGSGPLGSARAAMSAWLHSNGHRRTALSSGYRRIGIGMLRGSYRGHSNVQVWVAHFSQRC